MLESWEWPAFIAISWRYQNLPEIAAGLVDIGRVLTTVNSPFSDFPSDKPCESSPSSTDVPQPMFNSCSFEFFLNFHLVLTLNFCDSFCCKESFHIDRHWKPSRKSTKWNEWSFLSARNWHLTQDGRRMVRECLAGEIYVSTRVNIPNAWRSKRTPRQNLTKSSRKTDNKIYTRHSYAVSLEQFYTLNYITSTIAYKDQIGKPVKCHKQ